jgi:hypothetical protein
VLVDLSDKELFELLSVLCVLLAGACALYLIARKLERSREGLLLMVPLFTAFGVRLGAVIGVDQLSIAQSLRGGDELTFLKRAGETAQLPLLGSESLDKLTSQLHTFTFSVNFRMFDLTPPEMMMRVEMIVVAVLGIAFLSAAVYELAGPRAALIAAWVLALEPANVFFSSLLHKEPLMYFAEGLVAFGGAVLWKRGKLTALLPMVAGCLIAIATRPYVGWFLTAAAAAVVLHASLTRQRGLRSFVLTSLCLVLVFAFVPVVWEKSSSENLKALQGSQDANARDDANLSLERVDYSTREKLIINLPQRVSDVILRPYFWQTDNASQQLGALGTLVVLACLALLSVALAQNRRAIMPTAAPLVYPVLFMLIAYAISAGNAGTAFRYRTHVVGLAVCLVIVLLAHRRQEQEGPARVPARPGLGPVSRTRTAT